MCHRPPGCRGPDVRLLHTVANINWYFPEPRSKRVHFVSTFINADQGQAASQWVHELLRFAEFERDALRTIAVRRLG